MRILRTLYVVMLVIPGSFELVNGERTHGSEPKKAVKASNIAQKAAQEAKAASDAQNIAGQQAAHQVKSQLAEKAVQAAKSAQAALSGKEAIVDQLQEEVKEARSVVNEESSSLRQVRENLETAEISAQETEQRLKVLEKALRIAKSNQVNADLAARGAQKSLEEREELLEAAKRRVEELRAQLKAAKSDLASTNGAAIKAKSAARDAAINANRNDKRFVNVTVAKRRKKSIEKNCKGVDVPKKQIQASNVAQKAAEQAKAASQAQNIAGAQAAHQVKSQLAEKAVQAARAAETALAGKEAIVDQLQQELKEARAVVREETISLRRSEKMADFAMLSAKQAKDGFKILMQGVKIARANLKNAEATVDGASREYKEKKQLVRAAKKRTGELQKDEKCARTDLMRTKEAAVKAEEAAHEAKINANRIKRGRISAFEDTGQSSDRH